jgi:hypothetical protein
MTSWTVALSSHWLVIGLPFHEPSSSDSANHETPKIICTLQCCPWPCPRYKFVKIVFSSHTQNYMFTHSSYWDRLVLNIWKYHNSPNQTDLGIFHTVCTLSAGTRTDLCLCRPYISEYAPTCEDARSVSFSGTAKIYECSDCTTHWSVGIQFLPQQWWKILVQRKYLCMDYYQKCKAR